MSVLTTALKTAALYSEIAGYTGTEETEPSKSQFNRFLQNLPGYTANRARSATANRLKQLGRDIFADTTGVEFEDSAVGKLANYKDDLLETVDTALNRRVSYTSATEEKLKEIAGKEHSGKSLLGYTTERGEIYINKLLADNPERELTDDITFADLLLLTSAHEYSHKKNMQKSEWRVREETKRAFQMYATLNRKSDPEGAKKAERAYRAALYLEKLENGIGLTEADLN